jgi:hypothetical protein
MADPRGHINPMQNEGFSPVHCLTMPSDTNDTGEYNP